MESFFMLGSLLMSVMIFDDNGQLLILLVGVEGKIQSEVKWMQEWMWFGYSLGFCELVLKKSFFLFFLSIVYFVLVDQVLEWICMLIINVIVFNIFSGVMLFVLVWMYEWCIFIFVENDVQCLEEYEQFNCKIVVFVLVGICILCIVDGINIFSNELVYNYLNMLIYEDCQWLMQIICGQQVNFVDVLISNYINLQISFVYLCYCNENVVICVLVDVFVCVKMEELLQEMVQVVEQVSQLKLMFLVIVSYELCILLYGIIGNFDLLQIKVLLKGVDCFVMVMNNFFSLLLKIISDIFDFLKIEFEQLKIELWEFFLCEVMNYIFVNYLLLVVCKQLGLYCFIELDVLE